LSRSRFIVTATALTAAIVAVPILSATALAADPVVTVRSGDTLTAISRRHGVDIGQLVALNRIGDANRIYAGQRLRLEPKTDTKPSPKATARPTENRRHTVRGGENLTTIARHYGVSISAIVGANGIANPSRIFGGQRLEIPGATAPASSAAARPAAPAMPASMAELVARRDAIRSVIVAEAKRRDVPAAFALAVAWQESGWQQNVVSHAGAVGVMQLMPATGEWVGAVMLRTSVNIHDRRQNVRAGVRLLAHYLDRYDGDRDRVLAAYYQGQSAVDRHGIYSVSRPYIASIKALTQLFGG
jgi:LysM repeat protein